MKKLITICLIVTATFTLKAQQLSGTQEFNTFGGSRYTIINWSVNYQITLKGDAFYISLSNPRVSAAPSSLYGNANGGGKLYSKTDLGLSTWPDSDPTPYNMEITLNLQYPDGTNKKQSATIREESYIVSITQFNNLKNASPSSFKVTSVESMQYNGGSDEKLDRLIAAKSNGKTNSSSANSPISNYDSETNTYSNPLPQSQTKSTSNSTIEALSEFSNATAPLLEQWGNNIRKRREAEQQQAQAEMDKKKKNGENELNKTLEAYLKDANNGDENARMHLIGEANRIGMKNWTPYDYMLSNRTLWLLEASKNKNQFAMNVIGFQIIYIRTMEENYKRFNIPFTNYNYGIDYQQALLLLEESAKLGSMDAMMVLAYYYGRSGKTSGNDSEKAFYWYSEAAKLGSTIAMYNLGMIYRYRKASGQSLKYKIKNDNSTAFYWFVKSTTPSNISSTMFTMYNFEGGSKSVCMYGYEELAIMYEKGLGCTKDLEVAKKLQQEYDNWRW